MHTLRIAPLLALFILFAAASCSSGNSSSTDADFSSVRTRRLVLTDEAGEPIVGFSAQREPGSGRAIVIVTDANGRHVGAVPVESIAARFN